MSKHLKIYNSTSLSNNLTSKQPVLQITGSKSETNRALLLKALYPNVQLDNTSNSDDSAVMQKAFETAQNSDNCAVDVQHAGTAMRFLTAYFAICSGKEITLSGSTRMHQRPIKILVEALRNLGADITYLENEGFPPLKINGKSLNKHQISINAEVSSQYISALLLIAPQLKNGLELTLDGQMTSVPYINMTLNLLNSLGIKTSFTGNQIKVEPTKTVSDACITIESDWSSASYWYAFVALCDVGQQITLKNYHQNSLQGDAEVANLYQDFGVFTTFNADQSITLIKKTNQINPNFSANLINTPDIAQTIAVTCFGLGISCRLTGLHTLKIKETDRLEALKNELTKLGAEVMVTTDALHLKASFKINSEVSIKTYQDHRMAMAFAVLGLKTTLMIEEAEVVNKSYPSFWDDLQTAGLFLDNV